MQTTGSGPEQVSVKKELIRGLSAMSVAAIVARLINGITIVILARLLTPRDFGIYNMALVAVTILEMLRDVGMVRAYLTYQGDRQAAANVVFYLMNGFALLAVVIGWSIAPWLAHYYSTPEVEFLFKLLCVTILLNTLAAVPRMQMQVQYRWGTLALSEVIPQLLGSFILIGAAWYGLAYWSFGASIVARSLSAAILSYGLTRWYPRWQFDRTVARALISFGKWSYLDLLLNMILLSYLDNIYLARNRGSDEVGYYAQAYNLMLMIQQLIIYQIDKINIVLVSTNEAEETYQRTIKFIYYSSILIFPIYLFLAAHADLCVAVLYGVPKWERTIPILSWLSIYGLLMGVYLFPLRSFFMGLNRPAYAVYPVLPALCFVLVGFWISRGSWDGVQIASLFTAARLVHLAGNLGLCALLKTPVEPFFRVILKPLLVCGLALAGSFLVRLLHLPLIPQFFVTGTTFCLLYGTYWLRRWYKQKGTV